MTSASAATAPYERPALLSQLAEAIAHLRFAPADQRRLLRACVDLADALDHCPGETLQERWTSFEQTHWRRWRAGESRPSSNRWTGGARVLVLARLVRPSWAWLADVHLAKWVARLPDDDPFQQQRTQLAQAVAALPWPTSLVQAWAISTGLRILLVRGYPTLQEITDADLAAIPPQWSKGSDVLDAALCALGVFARTPQRGASRRNRRGRLAPAELVARAAIPERFRLVTTLYLETYATRISTVYATLRHKVIALGHFWRFLDAQYPAVDGCAAVRPTHTRAYIPYARERARVVQRGGAPGTEERNTAHSWLTEVRTFFADLCAWATEPDSPFTGFAPPAVPLTRRDLVGVGFEQARQRAAARVTATVLDLERELPRIRAFALQRWSTAADALKATPTDIRVQTAEATAFWDWALVELLVQSGLRIEEASELTTLDILKRQLPDGRRYFLLHVKPSKYDRARVIPIGDGLGRVLAEIIRHVKRFYGVAAVPFCDHWDHHEKQPRPRAPYLLQGVKHPSAIGIQTIRGRLRRLSLAAGVQRSDGTPLVLLPHDCRRVFASEHLNNNTPVPVIQALLGHATLDTVMVYAKLYPTRLVEEYRKTVRGVYQAVHGEDSFRNPTGQEWAAFAAQCNLRDMGTHLCALPTGEHCPRGLVCLGCVHAQPKQSAVPLFRRMLVSHERELGAAHARGEPAGQLAARDLEVGRIRSALRRAEELPSDVAAAIEAAAGAEESDE